MRIEKRSYYEVVRDCVSESTAHGITYVFKRDEWYVKVLWLIVTLASTGVGSWLVGKSILDFLTYDTVTKAQTIFETPTLFPTVSICSQNMFTTDDGYAYVANYLFDNDYKDLETELVDNFLSDNDFFKLGFGANLLDTDYSDAFRKSMSLQIDDMILRCSYNHKVCDETDFYWYFDPFYG